MVGSHLVVVHMVAVLLQGDTPEQVAGMVVALEVYILPVEVGSLQQWVGLVAVLVADNLKKLCMLLHDGVCVRVRVCAYFSLRMSFNLPWG